MIDGDKVRREGWYWIKTSARDPWELYRWGWEFSPTVKIVGRRADGNYEYERVERYKDWTWTSADPEYDSYRDDSRVYKVGPYVPEPDYE